jgi:hypothetical protein
VRGNSGGVEIAGHDLSKNEAIVQDVPQPVELEATIQGADVSCNNLDAPHLRPESNMVVRPGFHELHTA